ncbi:hypothetical protein ACFVRU_12830 [Streptomyces sp. NPDC057927]
MINAPSGRRLRPLPPRRGSARQIPGDTAGPQLRQYTDDIEAVRVLYFVTALRTVVVVAYIEV